MPGRPAQTMARWVAPSNPTNLTVQAEKTMPNRKKIISPANHIIWLGEQNSLDLYLLNQERAQQFTRSEEHTSELQSQSNLLFPFFFFNDTAPTEIYPLSLHDALPISNHIIWLGEQNSLDLYLLNQERAQQFT